ncbi:endonuclease/exonuclease/phosphatase family protein [Allorhodopirellula solitaria]|uniref:Endonuclease/exonuclease/phosphatase domain-containing protein n=1 Tax=Allorhodopirellula solitaria TaxID=2527987 RepID=A0A5C5X030_9BACT|nr:endonuclease/exonuclease/phosphatase family protein [Allorhodopirellula solitaria]TWT56208.1 hypothetical protein CA85_43900 [Allorhodopirellula solitaria]
MSIAFIASVVILAALLFLAFGSLLSLSSHPHWFVRGWDFPRVQILVLSWALLSLYAAVRGVCGADAVLAAWPFVTLAVALTLWHGFRIIPYTVLYPKQVADTPPDLPDHQREHNDTTRLLMSNVEMENDQYERAMAVIRRASPDVVLMVEIDQSWLEEISEFVAEYPHRVIVPQDNWYGMMLLSKLPIERHEVRYLIQDDIPSIDASLRMDDGTLIRFIGVHPRPPEPIRDTDATARDAELILWGEELADEEGPVIIGGDLNDVAWSQTTRLFLRVSRLLDPRRGRGFFNSFHAGRWYLRFPLDHVFHSVHFTLSKIARLDNIGSDHFPIMIDLRLTPEEKSEHNPLEKEESDDAAAEERLQRAADDETLDGDAVDDDVEDISDR